MLHSLSLPGGRRSAPSNTESGDCNSWSQVSSAGVGTLWRWRGWPRPAWKSNPSEFDSPPGPEARGAAFQELRPEAGPTLGTVPQTPSQRPPKLGLQPLAWPLPRGHSLPHCWLEGPEKGEDICGWFLSFTWGKGGSDRAGCGGAVGCRGGKPWGRVWSRSKGWERQDGGGSTLYRSWEFCPPKDLETP